MVSNAKRMKYVSDDSSTDSENIEDQLYNYKNNNLEKNPKKWLSRNALLARENRLKKKIYVSNLENEVTRFKDKNDKLSKIVDNQSQLIASLRKEIKYLKSVVANSTDIGLLIKGIHQSTGMLVSSSVTMNNSLNNYVSIKTPTVANNTTHPWDDNNLKSLPSPELSDTPYSDELFQTEPFSFDIPNEIMKESELQEFDTIPSPQELLQDHNYTSNEDEDVGVCLHLSKHRVSLEFCSTCSDNAQTCWND